MYYVTLSDGRTLSTLGVFMSDDSYTIKFFDSEDNAEDYLRLRHDFNPEHMYILRYS